MTRSLILSSNKDTFDCRERCLLDQVTLVQRKRERDETTEEGQYINYTHTQIKRECLGALSIDDKLATLVVLLFGNPHLMKGAERGENRTTDPRAKPSFGQ